MATFSRILQGNLAGRCEVSEATRKKNLDRDLYFDDLSRKDIVSGCVQLQDNKISLKQDQFQPYPISGRKVRAVTRKGTQETTKNQLQELIGFSFNQKLRQIMISVLHDLLNQPRYKWNSINKAIILIEALLLHGSEEFIYDILSEAIKLSYLAGQYKYIDWKGKDLGAEIRMKAGVVVKLLQNTELLTRKRLEVKVLAWLKQSEEHRGACNLQEYQTVYVSDDDSSGSVDDTEEIFVEFDQQKEEYLQSETSADISNAEKDHSCMYVMRDKQVSQALIQRVLNCREKFDRF
eukprot:TRINITY_DN9878_c2_g1_i10.p1 TRINITY_DN9878_c2_g1~~TRINITY_DN9878_c2_g1_i10.p1  ORF type:complete len:292 (-),score=15.61 TRINITY_DN9878_c2_g1_i10:276-1151(-)